MINVNKLKGAMVSAGYMTVEDASRAIGMNPATMYRRLKKGEFNSNEILNMIDTYQIEDPMAIFFIRE